MSSNDSIARPLAVAAAAVIGLRLASHLLGGASTPAALPKVPVAELARLIEGDSHEFRQQMRDFMTEDNSFALGPHERELSVLEQRQQAMLRLKRFLSSGLISCRHILSDPLRFIAAHELISYSDPSACYLFSVQFNLALGSVLKLGTERHHAEYLDRGDRGELIGCFALTEFRHGVNSGMHLDTTATYDAATEEFVVNTPNVGAQKHWISLAATHARFGVVFAQLIVGEERHGVHAFIVPLRDDAMQCYPGVRIEDVGHKPILNGNDNGRLFFSNVRVPRGNLLDRYSQVAADGSFTSEFDNVKTRFLKVSDQLMSGRMCIAACSLSCMKLSLLCALRYSISRTQETFSARGGVDHSLYFQLSQRRALLPILANVFALQSAINYVKRRYAARSAADEGEVLRLVCAFKAYGTCEAVRASGVCRDKTGGQGLISANNMCDLNALAASLVVVEGDSMLLAQKVAGELLKAASAGGVAAAFVSGAVNGAVANLGVKWSVNMGSTSALRSLLAARETMSLVQLQRALHASKRAGLKTADAWQSRHLDIVQRVHRSFTERLTFDLFRESIDAEGTSPEARAVLTSLSSLFALNAIENDLGWYCAHTAMSRATAAAVSEQVNNLCHQITEEAALDLLEAFGIPDVLLTMPIASRDGWEAAMA